MINFRTVASALPQDAIRDLADVSRFVACGTRNRAEQFPLSARLDVSARAGLDRFVIEPRNDLCDGTRRRVDDPGHARLLS